MNAVKQGHATAMNTFAQSLNLAKIWATEPENTETLHDLRVTLRRLREIVAFLETTNLDAKQTEYSAQLKQMIHHLGPIRDQHVEKKWIENWDHKHQKQQTEPPVALSLSLLQDVDRGALSKITNEILKNLESSQLDTFLSNRLDAMLDAGKQRFELHLSAEYNKRLHRVQTRMLQLNRADKSSLHRFRVACKKLRYFCEALQFPKNKGERNKTIQTLSKIQDRFGKVQDLCQLKAALQKTADPNWGKSKISKSMTKDLDKSLERQTKKAILLVERKTIFRKPTPHTFHVA